MAAHRLTFEHEIEADSPEDAALKLASLLRSGKLAPTVIVDVAGGKVAVETEEGNESVIRDDRKRIGPVVMRREGPTGVMTSPVMAEFCEHDSINSRSDLEQIDGKWLRLRGFGPEAYYVMVDADGTESEPFAVITVHRRFASHDPHPAAHLALAAYARNAQH